MIGSLGSIAFYPVSFQLLLPMKSVNMTLCKSNYIFCEASLGLCVILWI